MSGIRPIPKLWLIHEVSYEEYLGSDGWDGSFAEPVTVKNVRVEPATVLNRSGNVDQVEGDFVLFIDAVHSKPLVEIKERSRVTFQGATLEVQKNKPHYGFKLHHYEVILK